ncbi:MAG: periplasmic heavy metal sensor [Acidobacteriota bacterium]
MRRWWVIIALLLSVGVNVGILAALATRRLDRPERQEPPPPRAEPGPPAGPEESGQEGGPPRAGRLADRLGLEGEPRRRFLAVQQEFFEQTVRIRLHMTETQREVRRELMSREPDRQQIDALLQDSSRDFLELERALAKNVVESREILDPGQEREFLRVVASLRPQAGGFGPRPNRRPGPPPWRENGRRPLRDRFEDDGPPPEEDGPP